MITRHVDNMFGEVCSLWYNKGYSSEGVETWCRLVLQKNICGTIIWVSLPDLTKNQKESGEIGHRSRDLLHAKQALYHLSYFPMF